jgi:hypothetical protein
MNLDYNVLHDVYKTVFSQDEMDEIKVLVNDWQDDLTTWQDNLWDDYEEDSARIVRPRYNTEQIDAIRHYYGTKLISDKYGPLKGFLTSMGHELEGGQWRDTSDPAFEQFTTDVYNNMTALLDHIDILNRQESAITGTEAYGIVDEIGDEKIVDWAYESGLLEELGFDNYDVIGNEDMVHELRTQWISQPEVRESFNKLASEALSRTVIPPPMGERAYVEVPKTYPRRHVRVSRGGI